MSPAQISRFNSGQGAVSVEYFPPKGLSSERALVTGAHALRRFAPSLQTVTFGAGGAESSPQEVALEWCSQLQGLNEVPTACHLALCYFNQQTLAEFAGRLWENDIKKLVVLRGDAAMGDTGCAGYNNVAEAIAALKSVHPFDISVAAYPEIHPKAANLEADIAALVEKQDAGADRAITQYFFDNEDFYSFRDEAAGRGFWRPIIPGIMPIANFEKIKEFSEKCGAKIPAKLHGLFAKAGDDKAAQTDVARTFVEEQVRDLARNGVSEIHIYSLNRVDLTADTIRAFQDEFLKQAESFRPALVG